MALKARPFTYILMGLGGKKKKEKSVSSFFDRVVIKEDFS